MHAVSVILLLTSINRLSFKKTVIARFVLFVHSSMSAVDVHSLTLCWMGEGAVI